MRAPFSVHSLQTINTSGTANTSATTAILAAIANQSYLVLSVWYTLAQNEPAANIFRMRLSVGGTFLAPTILAIPGRGSDHVVFPDPGYLAPVGASISVQHLCTAVTRPFEIGLTYYLL